MVSARDEESPSLWTSTRFALSTVMMLVLVVAGVWLGVSHLTKPVQGQAQSSPGGSATGVSDSAYSLEAEPQDVPTAQPETHRISLSPELVIQTSAQAGPRLLDEVPLRFAHSPTGAVMSAANFMQACSSKWRMDEVAQEQMASGPERDEAVADIKAHWDGRSWQGLRALGFKADVRGPDEVLVTLAAGLPQTPSQMTSWPLLMVWDEGDWKFKQPGNNALGEEPISSLYGFIPLQE